MIVITAIVLYCRFKYAFDPVRMADAMFCIASDPIGCLTIYDAIYAAHNNAATPAIIGTNNINISSYRLSYNLQYLVFLKNDLPSLGD